MASTIAHYRAALSVPLRKILHIDVLNPAVSDMIKAMSIARPSKPFVAPSWNLQKVLDYIEGLPANISYDDCLARAAFLLLLATGWRISELHACVRMSDYCSINVNNQLKIRPHEIFLAKNELSHTRWPHTTVNPLVHNNNRSKLCPVLNLTRYLHISNPKGVGPLFTDRSARPIRLFQLSKRVCTLILKGDPSSKVKIHDVRKFASSLSFMNNMDIKELLHAMNWKSSTAFFKHYLSVISIPRQPIVIPGGASYNHGEETHNDDVVNPDDDLQSTD